MNARDLETVERGLRTALTTAELIEYLSDFPPDTRVVFESDYGDHCHTMAALPVRKVEGLGEHDAERIEVTAYSDSGLCIRGLRDYEEDDIDTDNEIARLPKVVVLRR